MPRPHSSQVARPGISRISSSASSSTVLWTQTSKQNRSASGKAAASWPTSTVTRNTRPSPARSAQASAIEQARLSSCIQQIRGNCCPASVSTIRFHGDHAGGFPHHFPNDSGVGAGGVGPHRLQHPIHLPGWHDDDQLTLVRKLERIQQRSRRRPAGFPHWQIAFANTDTNTRSASKFVQHRGNTASCGVAQAMYCRAGPQHDGDKLVQRLTITGGFGFERKLVPGDQNSNAMLAECAADEHRVARAGAAGGQRDSLRNNSDAGSIDEQLVGRPALHNLRITRYDGNTSAVRHVAHTRRDPPPRFNLQPPP